MAYNPFGEDTGVEDFSGRDATEAERKKRLATLAALAGGVPMGDVANKMIGDRIAPISQAIENPQAALQQRFGEPIQRAEEISQALQGQQPQGPVGPVMPQDVAQQRQQQLPVGQTPPMQAMSPEQFQQIQNAQNVQLPQAGPGVQVAGPSQMPPKAINPADANAPDNIDVGGGFNPAGPAATRSLAGNIPPSAEVSKAALSDVFHESFVKAANSTDPKERRAAFAQLISNPQVPEGIKNQANQLFVQDWQNQSKKQEAMQKLENATPNEIARFMQEKNKDGGSYVKAILFQRLGLTELAKQEQEKISPDLKATSVTDSTNGQRYTAYRNKAGEIVKAFNKDGTQASQEELARLSAATLPTQAHQLPAVHGSPVQRTNAQGQVETGLMMYDPQSQANYVQVGNQRKDTTGWTTMSQTPQSVAAAAGAKVSGEAGAKGFDVNQPGTLGTAANIASSIGAKVISGNRTTDQQAALYQQSVDAGTPGKLPNGNPVAKPTESKHESGNAVDIDSSTLTADQRKQLAVNGFRQPLPKSDPNHWEYDASTANKKSPLYVQEAKAAGLKKEAEVVGEARGKEGAKVVAQQSFADNAHPVLTEIESIIKRTTGSGIGAGVDNLARIIGASPKGAQAIAELRPLAGAMTRMIPRFEGSQSDADVREYKQNAGDFANPELPVKERLAALQGMVRLMKIYDKDEHNDWSVFGEGNKSNIKIISREKVQ